MKLARDVFRIPQMEPKKLTVFMKPSVEYTQEDAFLPDKVENLMPVAKPVPTIAGITKQEGYMLYRGEERIIIVVVL